MEQEQQLTADVPEAYEPTTYDATFPALPTSGLSATPVQSAWTTKPKMQLRTSKVTQVFHVPMEERRFKNTGSEVRFGQDEQAKICKDIMQQTGTSIEINVQKDKGLSVVCTGKPSSVMEARRLIFNRLQTQAFIGLSIPKEYHRFILGKGGKKLQQIELETATKIKIPQADSGSDEINISGTREGIEKARHEITVIYEEQSKLAFERLNIPKVYHPFINGPENQIVKDMQERTKVRVNVPPPPSPNNDIIVSGEKDGVAQAKAEIMKIYEEKKRSCQTVSVEVRKAQHKYVIGPKRTNLHEILAQTGVSVEVPHADTNSDTITLRGDADKLGPALTIVYAKANSVISCQVDAPNWIHRYIIGRKGAKIQELTQNYPKVHVEFGDDKPHISLEGPPEECEPCRLALEAVVKDLLARMDHGEVSVPAKFHKHIIGKAGANITKVKDETKCQITIPGDDEGTDVIKIEGEKAGVAKAKQMLAEMGEKLENERSRDILIEQRFHRQIIGQNGNTIRDIREKFNDVQVNFPDPGKKSDVVTVRGAKNDVDKCHKYLTQMNKDLLVSNYQGTVKIFKEFHKNIIGKGGANIRKIRDETNTRIDLPSENSQSDVIAITGKKENVEQAIKKIEDIQKELADIKEVTLEIPYRLHNAIIGAKGRLVRAIMDECGGVMIRFPPEGTKNDKVTVRGPSQDVDNAAKQLKDLMEDKKESSFTAEVRAKPEFHKFLIGRQGSNVRKIRDETGARVAFPRPNDEDADLIVIMGKEDAVQKAKTQIEDMVKNMENIVDDTVEIDPKHHRHFVMRRGEVLNRIADEFGGVSISFPRNGSDSVKVQIRGAVQCVAGAKARLLDEVKEVESQVTIEVVIPQRYHRGIMGMRGANIRQITADYHVNIKFPERPPQVDKAEPTTPTTPVTPEVEGEMPPPLANGEGDSAPVVNGGETPADAPVTLPDTPAIPADAPATSPDTPSKYDIIMVSGKDTQCELAKEAMMALVPITEEVEVPFEYHRFIIGQKGAGIRKLMDESNVRISVPSADNESDIISITGPRANVDRAKVALSERMVELEGEKEDRALRSYKETMEVKPEYHFKIIGPRGATVNRFRDEYGVNIQLPRPNSEEPDTITIQGYEEKAKACKAEIEKMIADLEKMITETVFLDVRVHSRIIGGRGKQLRRICDDFKVEIKFPGKQDADPNLVRVMGMEDDVLDCVDYLRNMEEDYMQDVVDRELMQQYEKPSRSEGGKSGQQKQQQQGFFVKDAPWSRAPDMQSTEDFPSMAATNAPQAPTAWGPPVKRF